MARWLDPMAEELDTDTDPAPFDGWRVLLSGIEDRRPDWHAEAACRGADPSLWFPERGQSIEPARAICAGCPCADACELYALDIEARHGIWAGEAVARRGRQQAA